MSLQAIEYYADDVEDAERHYQWLEYCRVASTIDRERILECVLSDLDAEDSLAALGQAVLDLIAHAVDDQVNLRMNSEVPRD